MLPENDLTGEKLAGTIRDLLSNSSLLDQMAKKMKSMGKPGATDFIIDECLSLIDNKVGKS